MATIYEVAEKAGVSPATVSRVFNGIAVSQTYADRVRAAAEELHYEPNRTARRLRRRSSEVIALVIPDIENPFFTSLARGVEDRALEAGFSVVLCNTDERQDKESRYLKIAVSEHMAGVIIAPATHHPDLDEITARRIPVVAVDRSAHGYDLDTVVVDDTEAGRAAAEQLYEAGHARVACITGPSGVDTAEQRAAGWREVFVRRHPGDDADEYLRHANYRVDGGQAAAEALLALDDPPDAVFVANNLMAVGVHQALRAAGVTMAVLALGDLPFGMLRGTEVEVLPLPARRLGTTAAELLLSRIQGDDSHSRRLVISRD